MAHQGDVGRIVLDIEQGGVRQGHPRREGCGHGARRLGRGRQADGENRPFALATVAAQLSAHGLDQTPRHGQAQTRARDLRSFAAEAIEGLEQAVHVRGGQARPGVMNTEADPLGRLTRLDQHHAAGAIVFDGVGDQGGQHLPQALSIGQGRQAGDRRRLAQFDSRRLGHGTQGLADLSRHQQGIDALHVQSQTPALDVGQVQHLVDQGQQPGAGGADLLQGLMLAMGQGLVRLVQAHQVGKTDDGVQRGAQFVAHAGQELGLGPVRRLDLGGLALGDGQGGL
ncbi:hypothetical protein D3C80_1213490 [compost metagenome]